MIKNIFKIIKIKVDFSPLLKKKIIIFDKNGEDILKKVIDEEYHIIYARYEQINFFLMLKTLFSNFYKIIKNKKFFLYYYIQSIKYHNPKIVITYIDNNLIFYELKKYFKNINFIAIQNGYRFYEKDLFELLEKKNIKIDCDKYYCFGPSVKNELKNFLRGQIISHGSLKNNICTNKRLSKENTICFISAYGVSDLKYESKIINSLIEFCNQKKIQIAVLPRRNNIEEKQFYDKIFNNNKYLFIRKEKDQLCKSYEYLDKCLISISVNGTLGYENLARSNKTLFVNCNDRGIFDSSYTKFGWPGEFKNEGFFWTNIIEEDHLKKKMEDLIYLDDIKWKNLAVEISSKIILYDPDNKTLIFDIKKILEPKL